MTCLVGLPVAAAGTFVDWDCLNKVTAGCGIKNVADTERG